MFIAARAYKQAMATLTYLKVHDTLHPPHSSSGGSLSTSKSSFISSFLPNLQGQGPTGSLLRILFKLKGGGAQRKSYQSSRPNTTFCRTRKYGRAVLACTNFSCVYHQPFFFSFQTFQFSVCSSHLRHMYHLIRDSPTVPLMNTHQGPGMQRHNPFCPSFMLLAIRASYLWIKGKHNYTPHLQPTEETRGHKCS